MNITKTKRTGRVQPVVTPQKHHEHPVFQNLLTVKTVLDGVAACEGNCKPCRERAQIASNNVTRILDIFV